MGVSLPLVLMGISHFIPTTRGVSVIKVHAIFIFPKNQSPWSAPNVLLDNLLLVIQDLETFYKFALSSLLHKFS